MEPDLAAYRAVSDELRDAERRALLRRLVSGESRGKAEEAVLAWLAEFQLQRTLLHLVLRDLADPVMTQEGLRFRVSGAAPDVPRPERDAEA